MADESKKIILQLQIDAAKSITDIVSLKGRIAELKAAQKDLNLSTTEGQKANEAYTAQIKALTKEQKSLELAVEKTAAGFEYEEGSIAANRAELSKLTAEYKNLANPTDAQTKKIKDLSDRLKEQEAAIGNTTRNVGNYKEAFSGIQAQLGAFGPQTQQLSVGFTGISNGLKTAQKGFTSLRGAIISTGIGALLVAFGLLISYFKNTDDGATKLEGIFGALNAVMTEITGIISELGGKLFDVATGSSSLEDTLSELGDVVINNLVNRIKSVLVLGDAVSLFFEGKFSESAKKGLDAVIQFNTGIEGGTDQISAFAIEMAAAAKQAFEYALKLDAINDAQRDFNIVVAKSDQAVQQLIISAKNKTLTDQERIDLLLKANTIEEQTVLKQKSLDQQRLDLLKERNLREQEAINSKLARDLADTDSEEKKIKIRQQALQISDKLNQEEADQQIKLIQAETNFILLKEKNQNKIDVLNEKIAADREKAYQEYLAQLAAINNAEITLENQRQARIIANIDYELSKKTLSDEQRIQLLKQRNDEEIQLEKQLLDQKLSALTSESLQENANLQEIELKKQAILEASQNKKIDIERQTQDQITAVYKAAEDKRTADAKAADQLRIQQRQKDFQTAQNIISESLQAFTSANELALNKNLSDDEKKRQKELISAGNNKKAQDQVNKKYDKIEADDKRKAARTDLDIKSVQAVATLALGIMQALGSAPPPLNLLLAAITGAAGAIQIANLQSQKSKLAFGGLLSGPSHDAGGIPGTGRFSNVEVEGGEFVVNKRATKENLPLLHYINSYSKNRPAFKKMATGGILDGGLSARSYSAPIVLSVQDRNNIMDAIKVQPSPVVLVKDINTGINRNIQVKDRANVTK